MLVVVLRNYTIVGDGVLCQGNAQGHVRRVTTWAIKHAHHDTVPHGCTPDANVPRIEVRRGLLAVGWNGWFWGHFVQVLFCTKVLLVSLVSSATLFS
jgi:hypothetical protein